MERHWAAGFLKCQLLLLNVLTIRHIHTSTHPENMVLFSSFSAKPLWEFRPGISGTPLQVRLPPFTLQELIVTSQFCTPGNSQ